MMTEHLADQYSKNAENITSIFCTFSPIEGIRVVLLTNISKRPTNSQAIAHSSRQSPTRSTSRSPSTPITNPLRKSNCALLSVGDFSPPRLI